MQRFTVSLPEELLKDFDAYLERRGYENRSEAVRDLIRSKRVTEQWESGEEVVGVITLLYDHHQRKLQERLTAAQHNFGDIVVSTTHIHLDHDNCLEVIIVRGKARSVERLAGELGAIRGIKHSELSATSTGLGLL